MIRETTVDGRPGAGARPEDLEGIVARLGDF